MNSQAQHSVSSARGMQRAQVAGGQALTVAPWPGELTVIDGRVWVTRSDDLGDHVLQPGQSVRFGPGAGLVIEALDAGGTATVQWRREAQPLRAPAFLAGALAAGLRGLAAFAGGVAAGLRDAEAGLAALARKAASSARRAQFCISGGDSMASSGALK